MPHGDTIVNGDGVELLSNAAGLLDFARHELAQVLKMHVPRDELGKRVCHRDDRFSEVGIRHAGGAPEAAGAGHIATVGGGA